MNYFLHTALVVLSLLAAASCVKPSPESESGGEAGMRIDPSSLHFPVEGGSRTITIWAPERPALVDSPSWISFTPGAYDREKGKMTATISVGSNYTCIQEYAEVVFSAGNLSATLAITQDAGGEPAEPEDPVDEPVADEYDSSLTNANATSTPR